MRTRAKWIFVAKATALGARVPQAELFALSAGSGPGGDLIYVRRKHSMKELVEHTEGINRLMARYGVKFGI